MLVNKHYEYGRGEPEDLVTIDSNYGSGQIRDDVKEDLYDLIDAIRADGLELFVTRAYTSYDEQSELYDRYVSSYGESWAEMNTGHAGYSENQTGLSVDVLSMIISI